MSNQDEEKRPTISWEQFLTDVPPGKFHSISEMVSLSDMRNGKIKTPTLKLYCNNESCTGYRFFEFHDSNSRFIYADKGASWTFLHYFCRNCETTQKTYSLLAVWQADEKTEYLAAKLGEWPPFGPHIPSRVLSLIGPDKDLFIQGRRSENQGLGIGAFGYYRRVVDNQRNRILKEIIRAARRLELNSATISKLEEAAEETEFGRSLDIMQPAFPEAIKIKGHNPLRFLYSALSEGLHAQTDDECLGFARDIRVILTELAERLGQVLREQTQLDEAVGRLLEKDRNKKK